MGGIAGAASGAATGAKFGSFLGVPGAVIGGALGGLAGLFGSSSGSKAPAYQPLDLAKVISDARTNAASNYANSFSLEQQYNPQQAALRGTTNTALSNLASGNTVGLNARDSLLSDIGSPKVNVAGLGSGSTNPLLSESTARIMQQLGLGGNLDAETQNAVMRGALQRGGTAGIAGSGAARGLAARDLGLTSLSLLNQRIGNAQAAGTNQAQLSMQGDQIKLAGQQLSLNDYLQRLSGANTAAGQDIQSTGLLASIVDARALPESGLSPDAIASLYVGQNNAQNQVNATSAMINAQNRNSNLQALLGLGSLAKSYGGTKTGTSGSNLSALMAGVTGEG